jgi:hypothetical protein
MRKKCFDYLESPSNELKEELTSSEQRWVDSEPKGWKKMADAFYGKKKPASTPTVAPKPPKK